MKAETTFPLFFTDSRPTTASLRSEIITDFTQLLALEDEWSELERQSSSSTIFQSLPWLHAWWKAFGKHFSLSTIVVRDGGDIVGILPLLHSAGHIRFAGTPGADYCDCLVAEEMAPEIIDTALRTLLTLDSWHTCRFTNLRDESQFVRHSSHLPADVAEHFSLMPLARRSSLDLRTQRDERIAAMRRKSALKRHRNKFYRSGKVCFRYIERREEAHAVLKVLFEQHIRRRAMAGEHSQFLSPEWKEFYSALVDELDLRKQLRFCVLELDDMPVACHFGFENRGALVLYKPTFDIDFWELSPGDVLLSELLGYAGQHKLEEVDFTIGIEQYKEHFTNVSRTMYCGILDRNVLRADLRRMLAPAVHIRRQAEIRGFADRLSGRIMERASRAGEALHGLVSAFLYVPSINTGLGVNEYDSSGVSRSEPQSLTLSDLAELAVHHPVLLDQRLLQNFRMRLRSKERCYLIRRGNALKIAWTRSIVIPYLMNATAPSQVHVLYDLRDLCRQKRALIDSETAEWFSSYARAQGALPCVLIHRFDHESRCVLERSNFQCRPELNPLFRKTVWQH